MCRWPSDYQGKYCLFKKIATAIMRISTFKAVISRKSIQTSRESSQWSSNPLYDTFKRRHDYLRISLTDKCNLRCRYCMPEEGVMFTKRDQCLDLPELRRISTLFVKSCQVRKIRLTGGEPSIDSKLLPFMEHLQELKKHGLQTVAMTTNGMNLKKFAQKYKQLGLDAVNVSLDTLKPDRFEQMTRRKGWQSVMDGLKQAVDIKFNSIKVNCVVMKGFNDDELADFARLAVEYPIEVRFIEFMPFAGNKWNSQLMVTYRDMLNVVAGSFPGLAKLPHETNETSKLFKSPNMLGCVGFISSISDNFCSGCNRLRLTSDGSLKVCLFGRQETSLRDLMRNGATDSEVIKAISSALHRKERQHAGVTILQKDVSRPMIKIATRMFSTSSSVERNFSHLNSNNELNMVNINDKKPIRRTAVAQGKIVVGQEILGKIYEGCIKKGDILTVAKVAGIMGAKLTSSLIPLCHQIPLDCVNIQIRPCDDALVVEAQVETHHKTGVEMESLTAVSVTLLTIYDMCKSLNKRMSITDIKLVNKIKHHSRGVDNELAK